MTATSVPAVARRLMPRAAGLVALTVALVVLIMVSLLVGSKEIDASNAIQVLLTDDGSEAAFVVRELRLPRALLAVVVGSALGVAGALIQALTRNPLADPGILGVNAGAAFAVTIGIAFFGVSAVSGYVWFSFAGAIITTVVVYLLGSTGKMGATPIRLTLIGVAIASVLGGISAGITLLHPAVFDRMRGWGAGSLASRGWDVFIAVTPFVVIGLALAFLASRSLNAIALGEELARSVGAQVVRTRVFVIVAVTLLAGAATAAAGPIGFVGLMVPHVVRWLTGPDQRWIMPFTAVGAAILLIVSDIAARVILRPSELEVGIVTAFIGAPVLILLARRRKASGL